MEKNQCTNGNGDAGMNSKNCARWIRLLGVRWRVSAPCIWRKKIMPRKKKSTPERPEQATLGRETLVELASRSMPARARWEKERQEILVELASDRRRREDNFNACNAHLSDLIAASRKET